MFCIKCGKQINEEDKFCTSCGSEVISENNNVENSEELVLPASLIRRFLNSIIDSIAIYAFAIIVAIVSFFIFNDTVSIVLTIVAFFAYHLIFEALFQRTVGKMITGTKVVNLQGEKPSFLAILGRSLARYIPFEPLSFLVYGNYPTKGWHDRLSHTLVVSRKLTPEDVQKIDPEKIRRQKNDSVLATIIIVIFGSLFFIAILGIFSSIVLASLSTARDKGADAAITANLNIIRAEAELVYNDTGSYSTVCTDKNVVASISAAEDANGTGGVVCNDNETSWAASSPLKYLSDKNYCVDSVGNMDIIDYKITKQTSCSKIVNNTNFDRTDTENQLIYQELKKEADDINSVLPEMIDEETRLDRVSVDNDNKVNYYYTLVNYSSDEIDWLVLKNNLLPGMEDVFCYDADMEYYRENTGGMKWDYYDMHNSFIGSIELSNKDCF